MLTQSFDDYLIETLQQSMRGLIAKIDDLGYGLRIEQEQHLAGVIDDLRKLVIFLAQAKRYMAMTGSARHAEMAGEEFLLGIFGILKACSNRLAADDFSGARDLLTGDLRDSLMGWIIGILPSSSPKAPSMFGSMNLSSPF